MRGWSPGNSSSNSYYLYIKGGYIYVNAFGDGLDLNGSIVMEHGDVIINGPTSNGNGALDYDGSFKISGGFILATGSSGMAEAPSTSSTPNSLLVNFSTTLSAGKLIHLESSSGDNLFTFAPVKNYQSVVFSSPDLNDDNTYSLYYGGRASGTSQDGLYTDETYSSGTEHTTF